jgi:hypothetical protein
MGAPMVSKLSLSCSVAVFLLVGCQGPDVTLPGGDPFTAPDDGLPVDDTPGDETPVDETPEVATRTLVYVGDSDVNNGLQNDIVVFDADTGEVVNTINPGFPWRPMKLSVDGASLYATNWGGSSERFSAETGEYLERVFDGNTDELEIEDLADVVVHDGIKYVLSYGFDLFDAETGEAIAHNLTGTPESNSELHIHNGRIYVAGVRPPWMGVQDGFPNHVVVWDVATQERIASFGEETAVSMAFTDDNTVWVLHIESTDAGYAAREYDLTTYEELRAVVPGNVSISGSGPGHIEIARRIALDSDGNVLISHRDGVTRYGPDNGGIDGDLLYATGDGHDLHAAAGLAVRTVIVE